MTVLELINEKNPIQEEDLNLYGKDVGTPKDIVQLKYLIE